MTSKKSIFIIILIIILDSSFFYSQLSGAIPGKEKNGYSFGVSYGGANQFSDIPTTSKSWGAALSLGKTLYYDEYSPVSFDLLANASFLVTKGLDLDPKIKPFNNPVLQNTDYDIFYFNYKNSMFNLGIDGKITLNKFRNEQKWYTSFLLGGNWGIYTVNMDLKDASGNYYTSQFNGLQNLSNREKKKQLKNIFDGKYETKAEGFDKLAIKSTLMPSFGIEAGFDITNFISVFVADKLFYANTNYIDGDIHTDMAKDFLNYYSVGLNFYFHKKHPKYRPYRPVNHDEPADDTGYKIPKEVEEHNFPEVKIIVPSERPYISSSSELLVKAKITNIKSALDIYCKVNGEQVAFDFNKKFIQFVAHLKPGDNKIQIYGKNEFGQSRDIITVKYLNEREDMKDPEIQLVNPSESVSKSDDDIITIKALIFFVDDKKDISILANGQPFKRYKYNPETGEFKIKVRLAEGLNKFEIIAENEKGKVNNQFDIYYKMDPPKNVEENEGDTGNNGDNGNSEINDNNQNNDDNGNNESASNGEPVIKIIEPQSSYTNLKDTDLLEFKAKITGLSSKDQITFTVNDRKNKFFDFDPVSGILEDKISLFDDVSIIKLVAKNDYGTATKEITVMINGEDNEENEKIDKKIQFVSVSKPDEDCKVDIVAKIDDAFSKNELKLFLNQFEIKNFSFGKSNHTLKSTLYLDEGKNIIKIIFENNDNPESEVYKINCNLNGEVDVDDENDGNDEEDEIDKSEPVISVEYPAKESTVNSEEITFKASVEHVTSKEDIRIKLNNEPLYGFNFDPETGDVFTDMKLNEGPNIIYISAENPYGKAENTIAFKYEVPLKGPPSVLINSPRNGFTTDEETAVFRASIENVRNVEDIYVTFNGDDYQDFQYDKARGIIFSHLTLRLGKNTLRVEAENRLGTDADEVTFQFRKKVVPAVKILTPRKGLVMLSAFTPLEAIVQNIDRKTDAVIYVNGEPNRAFKLANERITAKIYLKNGKNEIIVKASNDYGMDADTTYVNFGGKPKKPSITLINPKKSGLTVHDKNFTFKAKVEGIKHSSNVNLTVNDNKIEDVFYYRQDKTVKADVKLKKGWNYITIVAHNDAGSEELKLKIFLD